MLLGNTIVSSLVTQLLIWLSCFFGRICSKMKLLMRSVEEENDVMCCMSMRNSSCRRRKHESANLKKKLEDNAC